MKTKTCALLMIGCLIALALVFIAAPAQAANSSPGCVRKPEWRTLSLNSYQRKTAEHFGTNGTIDPKRTHDGRITRKYPLCAYGSMDYTHPVDCKAGYALVVFDIHHRYIVFTNYSTWQLSPEVCQEMMA
jgi:hypothetical protein